MTIIDDSAAPADDPVDPVRPDGGDIEGALAILRRGLRRSPQLRQGLVVTLLMGLSVAVGRLIIPILIERAIALVEVGDDGSTTIDRARVLPTVVLAIVPSSWKATS